ncbi:fungal-specific transcription factor domain-containing protein [Xylariales sp. PMI_506]|nr:fungal-specific transcription factor domain-containing protein [Xylariales sp. PMI_506]
MRSKCLHDKNPPCKSCMEAGVPEECVFPSRGDPDEDRQFRHPRQRADKKSRGGDGPKIKREAIPSPGLQHALAAAKPPKWEDEWSLLPDVDMIKEGIVDFTLHYFQLGFIPKQRFIAQLEHNPRSISAFLLLSMLSISARFNKHIQGPHGTSQRAVDYFTRSAESLAINELYQQPTLERCQAFLLLSIAQQGSGLTNSSYINMGIATRMAALMRLHREETYDKITANSGAEEIIRGESARRTLWVLHSQDNLHSGPYKPFSLASADITALLPCDEEDFENAALPHCRAALEGTPPALANPRLPNIRPRSLFATLIQTHHLWGNIARKAVSNEKSARPGHDESQYATMDKQLKYFEAELPQDHKFAPSSLKGHRQDNQDLAYLGCTSSLRLCHIVLRKAYMNEMIAAIRGNPRDQAVSTYRTMARELYDNVMMLYEQVDAQYNDDRAPEKRVGTQMATFSVYVCGLLGAYFSRFPRLVSHQPIATTQMKGKMVYDRTVSILEEVQNIWPLASSWLAGLKRWFNDPNINKVSFESGTMTDGQEPQPHALLHPPTSTSSWQHKMTTLYRTKSTPPVVEERRHSTSIPETEPTTLAPLQPVPSGYAPPSLPPISPYSLPQTPAPPSLGQDPSTQSGGHGQHQGFFALYQAAQHQPLPQPAMSDSYSFMSDYQIMPIPDDGFGFNLQQMLDPSWSTPNAPAALYNYQSPDVAQYTA